MWYLVRIFEYTIYFVFVLTLDSIAFVEGMDPSNAYCVYLRSENTCNMEYSYNFYIDYNSKNGWLNQKYDLLKIYKLSHLLKYSHKSEIGILHYLINQSPVRTGLVENSEESIDITKFYGYWAPYSEPYWCELSKDEWQTEGAQMIIERGVFNIGYLGYCSEVGQYIVGEIMHVSATCWSDGGVDSIIAELWFDDNGRLQYKNKMNLGEAGENGFMLCSNLSSY